MNPQNLPERVSGLERLSEQQLHLNDQQQVVNGLLITVTARLGQEQVLHAERLQYYDEILGRLEQTLQAIKDMLGRHNGQ